MRLSALIPIGLLMIAPPSHAQNEAAIADARKWEAENLIVNARVPLEQPVKGAPYSADTIVQSTQTLGDGNHISTQNVGHVYRDGEGRTRREEEHPAVNSVVSRTNRIVSTKQATVSIIDPVAGYSYSLDPEHKIAWRTPLETGKVILDKIQASREALLKRQEQTAGPSEAEAREKANAEKQAAERKLKEQLAAGSSTSAPPLEHKMIEGLAVEGRSGSKTIPAGQIGNELPITITSEEWRSPDLKVLVLTRHNDPRSGETTYRLTNIVRAEPDPSLFMVPPDYTVRDTGIKRNPE